MRFIQRNLRFKKIFCQNPLTNHDLNGKMFTVNENSMLGVLFSVTAGDYEDFYNLYNDWRNA